MQEFLLFMLVAILAGGAGYCGGRWHGAALYAALKKQQQHDTEKFMAMLEERNESYTRYKANHSDQSGEVRRLQLELDKAEQRLQGQVDAQQVLQEQLTEQQQRIDGFGGVAATWNDERTLLREEKAALQSTLDSQQSDAVQLQARVKSLQERFESALREKASLQEQVNSREREAREFQRRAQKLEDSHDAGELTLAQVRSGRDELATRLAYAEGQLEAFKSLRADVAEG